MRLLLAEDDPMIGASVQRGLRQEGYSVDWLRDGREVAPALAAAPYGLLLLDLGLAARVRALLRRHAGRAEPVLRLGALSFDPVARSVSLGGQLVALSGRELALLMALLEQPGGPLSRAQLEERIYGWGEEVESNAVEVHLHSLRRKLGADTIQNLRGVGYFVPKEV